MFYMYYYCCCYNTYSTLNCVMNDILRQHQMKQGAYNVHSVIYVYF